MLAAERSGAEELQIKGGKKTKTGQRVMGQNDW